MSTDARADRYRWVARTDCVIGYARVQPPVTRLIHALDFARAEAQRDVATYVAGMDLALRSVPAGDMLALDDHGKAERFVHVRSDGEGAHDDRRFLSN